MSERDSHSPYRIKRSLAQFIPHFILIEIFPTFDSLFNMLIERNEFRIKFGQMKEALRLWKEIFASFEGTKDMPKVRILTDLTGQSYTLVMEMELRGLQDIGFKNYQWHTNPKAMELYQQVIPLCESAYRTLYTLEYSNH